MPSPAPPPLTSIRPYLIRAWHEWMMDNGLTPHILVHIDHTVSVPREYAQGGEIVLNISTEATGGLHLGNEAIRFQARFSGRVRDIEVPMERVASIFARENGQGMAFDLLPAQEDGDLPAQALQEAGVEPADMQGAVPPPSPAPRSGLSLVSKASPSESEAAQSTTDLPPEPPSPHAPPTPPKGGGLKVVK